MKGILASLLIKLGLDSKEFKSGMTEAKRETNKFGDYMKRVGGMIAGAFAVQRIAAFTKEIIKLAGIQAKAEAKVAQAVKSTGNAAGFSADELKRMASELQGITVFGDEKILNEVTAQLLTFTNITGENFKRTQKAVLDLATLLDGDLKSAAIQLGKALNDPTTSLMALTRSGIQFTQTQKNQIEILVSQNRLWEAQSIILDEIERQYGGQAEAMAKIPIGKIEQLKNTWGDIKEQIGFAILNSKEFSKSIQELSDTAEVMSSPFLSGYEKFIAFTDVTGKNMAVLADKSRKLKDQQSAAAAAIDAYSESVKAARGPIDSQTVSTEKQVKTVAELKTETDNLKSSIDGYGINQEAEIQKTLRQIKANEDLISSLTTLRSTRFAPGPLMSTRSQTPDIGAQPLFGGSDEVVSLEFDKIAKKIEEGRQKAKEQMDASLEDWNNFKSDFANLVMDFSIEVVDQLGAAFGELIRTGEFPEDFGNQVLGIIGGFISQLGKMFIALGAAALGFQDLLKSAFTNPASAAAAIAAGAALVLLGGAIKGFASAGPRGSGGGGGGGFSVSSQSYSAAAVGTSGKTSQNIDINVTGVLKGDSIYLSNQRTGFKRAVIG